MRKNKFLTFSLAVCSIFPAMFALTACGGVKTTVDDTTLAYALEFKDAKGNDYTNWQAECVSNKGASAGEVYFRVKYTGDAYQAYSKYATTNQEVLYINSYDDENEVQTVYKKNAGEGWTKTEGSGHSGVQDLAKQCLKLTDLSDLTFEYNSADKAYCATKPDGTPTEKFKDEITYKLEFKNEKLISVRTISTKTRFATETEEEKVFVRGDDIWTISYGKTTIDIPQDFSVVGSTQWNKALSFDGVTNYTLSSQGGVNSQVTKVTSTQARQETTNAEGKTNIVVYDTVGKKRYVKGLSSEKFTVTDVSGLDAEGMMNGIGGKPGNRYSAILDSFASFEYKADEKAYYIASATIGTSACTDVKLTFDNGKLIKTEYTYNGYNMTLTYTYGDAVVTIPSESECA